MLIRPSAPPLRGRATRAAAGLTLAAALLIPFAAPASATPGPPAGTDGLFGEQDPTYDGTYRQSLAILAYAALDEEPPAAAVDWLLDQQCANGGWQAFRADTSVACAASDIATYSGPDSNSTALAVQALLAVGADDAADDGLSFLEDLQLGDGGIPYLQGAASDTNSTALTAMAVTAAGIPLDGTQSSSGNSLRDALASVQIGCEGAAADRGGYIFQSTDDPFGNDYATVQAVLAASSNALPVETDGVDEGQAAVTCPATGTPTASERNASGAWYLAQKLDAGSGTIESPYSPGTTDWSSTRFAVMALAASGHGRSAMSDALDALAGSQATTIPDDDGNDRPGVLAELILANEAATSALSVTSGSGPAAPAPTKRAIVTTPAPSAATASPTKPATTEPTPDVTTTAPAVAEPTASAADATPAPTPMPSASAITPVDATPSAAPTTESVATPAPSRAKKAATPAPKQAGTAARIGSQATVASIDSSALLDRLDATLQVAAVTTSPTTTPPSPSNSSDDPSAQSGGSGADLANTGGSVPMVPAASIAALVLFAGVVLTALTSRRTRGSH